MNILFLSHHKWPRIGGVEKHVKKISDELSLRKINVTTISEEDINYPNIKILGLIYIWFWLFKNIKLIFNSDIVHIHDVFIWYLPFRFIFLFKKVFVTYHGWEGKFPIPLWNILNKKITNYFCDGSIAVGKYIEKWYGIESDFVIYGATEKVLNNFFLKVKNSVVWLGRQNDDTGINEFKKWVNKRSYLKVKYITNILNPNNYLKRAEYCVPSGYLSYLEAKKYGCKILTFANNKLKEDYWSEIDKLKKIPTWGDIANVYLKLWRKI